MGIILADSSNIAVLISYNNITTSGDSGLGILLQTNTFYNNVEYNNVNTSGENAYGLTVYDGSNENNLSYNNITTSGADAWGVYLNVSSFNNTFLGNNVNTVSKAFVLNNTEDNLIINGSITSQSISYYLVNTGFTNNFTATNFTTENISLDANLSVFSYRNDSSNDVWLTTSVTDDALITRSLIQQRNIVVEYNESSSSSTTGKYNLSGLLYSAAYSLKKNGVVVQNITSSAGGELNFSTGINGSIENIQIIYAGSSNLTVWFPINNLTVDYTPIVWNFSYTDNNSAPMNCSLIINGVVIATNSSVLANTYTYLTPPTNLSEGLSNWNLECSNPVGTNSAASNIFYKLIFFLDPLAGLRKPHIHHLPQRTQVKDLYSKQHKR